MSERKLAFDILMKISQNKSYSNIELGRSLKGVSPRSRGFVANIVYGCIQNQMRIDYIIDAYSSISINKLSPDVLNILRIGVYQLVYMDRVPLYAIVNESVEMAKLKSIKGYINGMLRSIARNDKSVNYPSDFIKFLSVYYSCPEWICRMWADMLGNDKAQNLVKSMADAPLLTARVNTLKISVSDFLEKYNAKKDELTSSGVVFEEKINIDENEGHTSGEFYIQDTASIIPCEVLDVKINETVFDMCAAPGGKTTCLSQLMNNTGTINAFDIHEHKLMLIEKTAERLGCTNIVAKLENSAVFNEKYFEKADKILVDAPCSGLGIMRRKPEIKYEKTRDDIKNIAKLQKDILDTASKYLKPGGTLVYSTCTICEEENKAQVADFLENHKNFRLDKIQTENIKASGGMIQLLPSEYGCDGFFVAKFVKTEE